MKMKSVLVAVTTGFLLTANVALADPPERQPEVTTRYSNGQRVFFVALGGGMTLASLGLATAGFVFVAPAAPVVLTIAFGGALYYLGAQSVATLLEGLRGEAQPEFRRRSGLEAIDGAILRLIGLGNNESRGGNTVPGGVTIPSVGSTAGAGMRR